jgi:hypothetical protein
LFEQRNLINIESTIESIKTTWYTGQVGGKMSLDLNQIINQIQSMAAYFKLQDSSKSKKLDYALETIHKEAADFERLNDKIKTAKTTWLVPGLRESIDISKSPVKCPDNHVVIATDGSHIDVDRHQSSHCFLINIGHVILQYGDNPAASLFNKPGLFFRDEDMVISSPDKKQVPIEGQLLGIKRSVEESRGLLESIEVLNTNLPVLALLDGTLVLWGLAVQDYPDYVIDDLLVKGFLKTLENIKKRSQTNVIGLASYISFPRSTEVVNALRLAVCPHDNVNCDKYCSGNNVERACDRVAGLMDRDILNELLHPGDRSAIFSSRSSIVEKYYGGNRICFFYIKLQDEICRVEVPEWIANREEIVKFIHSAILSQCELGFGYPVSLMEAHEQAVVTGADREQFWQLVEQLSGNDIMKSGTSAKQWSKKIRWI